MPRRYIAAPSTCRPREAGRCDGDQHNAITAETYKLQHERSNPTTAAFLRALTALQRGLH